MTGTGTSSRSGSRTGTFTRSEVLAAQVSFVVEATTKSSSFDDVAELGIAKNEYIEVININALDNEGKLHARITMRIDWELYRLHISEGRREVTISVGVSLGEQISRTIKKIVQFFCEHVEEKGLQPKWTVICKRGIDRERAFAEMGLASAIPHDWAEGEVMPVLGDVSALSDELSVDLAVVVPSGPGGESVANRKGGIVKWFSEAKGFGFIVPDTGGADVFVHFSQIVGHGFRSLVAGQRVSYSLEAHTKGFRAVNVTLVS